jgi:hypothetical protein
LPLRRTQRSKICNINAARLGEMPPAGLFIKGCDEMTIGEALERAEQLRPNCRIETETRVQWLREADALLRTKLFDRAAAGAFDAVGADRPWEQPVQDDQTLLAPPPFDALYPHLLCAQMDAALGETDRYAGEQAQYNALYAELAVWLRQNYPPRSRAQWRW